jgi:hypothetical protein
MDTPVRSEISRMVAIAASLSVLSGTGSLDYLYVKRYTTEKQADFRESTQIILVFHANLKKTPGTSKKILYKPVMSAV